MEIEPNPAKLSPQGPVDLPLQSVQVAEPCHGRASGYDGVVVRLDRLDVGIGPCWLVRDHDVEAGEVCGVDEGVAAQRAILGDGDDSSKLYVPPARLASSRLVQ
jgi:hypothetical protein